MVASFRDSTKKQYGYCLSKFLNVREQTFDSGTNTNELLTYLAKLYDEGKGYSAINTARSAISSVFSLFSDQQLGSNARVSRFMKGVFNTRPSLPRYSHTWDPEDVLKVLDVDSKDLGWLEFSRKVVFLVTLLSGQRISTIANILVSDISTLEEQLVIKVGLVKQSRPGFSQKPIKFRKFQSKPNLCAYTQLVEYIEKTKTLRPSNCQHLFITTIKPYKRASKDTLSNWVKKVLITCGLPSFSTHSLRGAGTSAALNSGRLSLDLILSTAGWSSESTFRKFYNRPVMLDESLDSAILGANSTK